MADLLSELLPIGGAANLGTGRNRTLRVGKTVAYLGSASDVGLRNLKRRVLSEATVVLDWFHIAIRFEHALQTATGLGTGTINVCRHDHLSRHRTCQMAPVARRCRSCLIKLARVCHWTDARRIHDMEGVRALRRHLRDLIAYLIANFL